ncbi:MAG TPA: 2-hydroxy-3-oxopropionate reductase [Conexibacter sp.]|nr:2-hydroxy-3-oxopropionate reductase [Conexibacter sp.]
MTADTSPLSPASSATAGVIGLGIMGAPIVRNLLRAGYPVVVWNRSPQRIEPLAATGAHPADSPRAVVEQADVTITMLSDSPDVDAVYRAPDGVLAGVASARDGRDRVLIDMSTIAPSVARELAAAAAERGAAMLDAPVSGGDVGAQEGTLSIMVGGDAAALARVRPLLEVLGTTVTHCGPSGAGQIVKACNQIVVALTLEAIGEALVLGSKAGVDPAVVVEALSGGLGASRVLEVRGPKLLARDFAPGFKLDLHAKDLAIVLATARELGVVLPGTSMVEELFHAEQARGHGDADNSTVVRALEVLAQHAIGGAERA